jgi:ribonuclease VapC
VVIDSSALVAVLMREDGSSVLLDAIEADPVRLVAAPTVLEVSIVLERRSGREFVEILDVFLARIRAVIRPFDTQHLSAARTAFSRFGKGRHPAGLNFGDCFSYALAQVEGEPLLFKGNDFSQTDVLVTHTPN